MALEQLVVELELDDANFTGRLKVNSAALRQFQRTVSSVDTGMRGAQGGFQGFGATMRDTLVTLGAFRYALETLVQVMGGTFGAIIRANAQLEKMQVLMKGLSKETSSMAAINKEAEGSMQYLLDLSQASPTNLSALTDSFVKMRSAGIDPANGSLQALVDSVAKFGGSDEQLKRASIAMQQMAGKGVISMEELRQQLGEAIPNAMVVMARGVGLPLGELVAEISSGSVASTRALKSMLAQMQFENAGSAAEMAKTWDGLMNRLQTKWLIFAKGIGDAGYFEEAKESLRQLLEGFLSSNEAVTLARDLGQALTQLIVTIRSGIQFIYEYRDAIGAVLQIFIAIKAVKLAGNVFGGISASMMRLDGQMLKGRANVSQFAGSLMAIPVASARAQAGMGGMTTKVAAAGAAQGAAAKTATVLGTAFRGLGTAASVALGPLGVLAGVVAALGFKYYQTRKRAEELRAELRKGIRSDLNQQEMESARAQIEDLDEQLEDKRAKLQRREDQRDRYIGTVPDRLREEISQLENSIRYAVESRAALSGSITETVTQQAIREARSSAQQALDEVSRSTTLLRAGYQAELDALDADLRERGVTRDEYQTEFLEASISKRNAILQSEVEQVKALINGVAAEMARTYANGQVIPPEATAAAAAQIQVLQEQLINLQEQMRQEGGFDLMESLGGDEKKELPQYQQWINRITERMVEMKAKANEANPYLAELEVRMKAWVKAGEEINETDLRGLAAQVYETEQAINTIKEAQSGLADLNSEMGSLEQRLLKRGDKSGLDFGQYQNVVAEYNDVTRTIEETRAKAEEMRTQLNDTAQQFGISAQAMEEYQQALAGANRNEGAATDNLNAAIQKQLVEDRLQLERDIVDAKGAGVEIDRQTIEALNGLLQLDSLSEESLRLVQQNIDLMMAGAEQASVWTRGWLKFSEEFYDISDQMSDVWYDSLNGMGDLLSDVLLDGEADLESFLKSMTKMITQLLVKMAMVRAFEGATGFFGAGSSGATSGSLSSGVGINEFARGGIMSSYGPLAMKKYANGGIARSPQLALFGEGRMPEAYVPLPDGRSIPVTVDMEGMKGGGAGAVVAPVIGFNLINQSGERLQAEQQGDMRFNGEGFVVDVLLRNLGKPGPVRDAVKGANR
jgi:lambda family phage tail tape measure protein